MHISTSLMICQSALFKEREFETDFINFYNFLHNKKILILYNADSNILSLETHLIVFNKFPSYMKISVKQKSTT